MHRLDTIYLSTGNSPLAPSLKAVTSFPPIALHCHWLSKCVKLIRWMRAQSHAEAKGEALFEAQSAGRTSTWKGVWDFIGCFGWAGGWGWGKMKCCNQIFFMRELLVLRYLNVVVKLLCWDMGQMILRSAEHSISISSKELVPTWVVHFGVLRDSGFPSLTTCSWGKQWTPSPSMPECVLVQSYVGLMQMQTSTKWAHECHSHIMSITEEFWYHNHMKAVWNQNYFKKECKHSE